jgi:hypothetical protein
MNYEIFQDGYFDERYLVVLNGVTIVDSFKTEEAAIKAYPQAKVSDFLWEDVE